MSTGVLIAGLSYGTRVDENSSVFVSESRNVCGVKLLEIEWDMGMTGEDEVETGIFRVMCVLAAYGAPESIREASVHSEDTLAVRRKETMLAAVKHPLFEKRDGFLREHAAGDIKHGPTAVGRKTRLVAVAQRVLMVSGEYELYRLFEITHLLDDFVGTHTVVDYIPEDNYCVILIVGADMIKNGIQCCQVSVDV